MNAPTIIAALIVLVVFAAIVGNGIYKPASRKGRLLLRRRLRGLRRSHCGNTRHS